MYRLLPAILFAIVVTPSVCISGPLADDSSEPERLRVFVSIPPQASFVDRVGGERVSIEVLVRPGRSPATYEPTPRQMVALDSADIYFRIGVPFETRLTEKIRIDHGDLRIVDMHLGVQRADRSSEEHRGQREDAPGRHSEIDPHVWLDPGLVRVMIEGVAAELTALRPEFASEFEANLTRFQAELDSLNRRIADLLKPYKGQAMYVFHPAYGHFAEAYGLRQVAVEVGGKEPNARQVAQLIDQARSDGAKVIFVQPEFSEKTARTVTDAIEGEVVPLDPLAEDYVSNLWHMAVTIAEAFDARRSEL